MHLRSISVTSHGWGVSFGTFKRCCHVFPSWLKLFQTEKKTSTLQKSERHLFVELVGMSGALCMYRFLVIRSHGIGRLISTRFSCTLFRKEAEGGREPQKLIL